MQRQFNESNQQKSIKIQHAPTCKIAHLAEHLYFHPGSNRATSKKVCTIFSLSGWHLPETMKRGKRGPEGKRACRRHDMLQDFCKLRQRKSKGIHCETHHQQPWHSVSRNGPVCHTDWLWNGGNLGAPIQDTHGYTMSPSYTPIHTPTYYNLHLASVDSFTPLNRWGGIAAMNRCTMSDCPVHHFMWGTHEQ